MNRILACWMCVVVVVILMIAGSSFLTQAAPAVTPVCGTLNADATWSAINSPYEVCAGGLTVSSGVTLIVEPGVTVQFLANSRLTASGSLLAYGTPSQPITFTGVVTSPGSWVGILGYSPLITPAQISLDYVTLEYGGLSGYYGAQLSADHADLKVSHSLMRGSAGSGIFFQGIGDLTVHDTRFVDNALDAIRLVEAENGMSLSNLTAAGNGRDVVYLGSTTYVRGQQHWPAPGIPYLIDVVLGNLPGDSLTIDPGNELQFTSNGWLNIGGELKALGLPDEPITLTGQTKTPGAWNGLVIYGTGPAANVQLNNVTVEFGGRNSNGANIDVTNGYLVARNSRIRYSQSDGVRYGSGGIGTLLNSQVVGNALYGIRNTHPTRFVLAANDWWGDPSGPASDLTACGPGLGDRVTAGVLFRPVLTDANTTEPFPLSDAPILILTPRRWFAPANGTTRVYFDILMKDGNGAPLAGRTVRLSTSLGVATDGGVTDVTGHTLAYLVASTVGEAEVTAAADALTACEGAMSPTSKISFTQPLDLTDLMPNSAAPYVNSDLVILPKPTVVGITSTLTANLTNPFTQPITVDVGFDYVQSSIGLVFGPVAEVSGIRIPANSTLRLEVPWIPKVSGHFCFQVRYDIVGIGVRGSGTMALQAGSSGSGQDNTNSILGALLDNATKAPLYQTEIALGAVNWFIDKAIDTDPFGIPFYLVQQQISWMMVQAADISHNLVGDPPRQDYDSFAIPPKITLPPIAPPVGVSPALVTAMDHLRLALADVVYYGRGSTTSLDRYGGASAAGDMLWSSQQSNAMLHYNQQMAWAMITATQAISGFYQVLVVENIPDVDITLQDVIDYQNRLSTQGFSASELAGYQSLGLTVEEIESLRQRYMNVDPEQVVGSPRQKLLALADRFNNLALRLLYPEVFAPHFSVGGGAGLLAVTADSENTMAQVNETLTSIQVGNPLTHTATIELRLRRIDLPPEWGVSVSPAQVTLSANEYVTVTVSILPGAPVPQGITPQVAVEGYVNGELLGGVAIQLIVPRYVQFDGKAHLYMPLVVR